MSDSSSGPAAQFVTIAEAARRLGTSPRQARRWADKLPAEDRDTAGTEPGTEARTGTGTPEGQSPGTVPLRVRFAALAAYAERAATKDKAEGATEDTCEDRDRDSTRTGGDSPSASGNEGELPAVAYRAIITRQEREIEHLKRLLDDANERQRLTLEALAREQTLRALPAPPTVSQEPETGRTGNDSRNGTDGPQRGAQRAERRSWWQVWRRQKEEG